ncbi:cytochrome c3 family protein [Sorangium sp. So ce315]|uniref:cytochrome c3 family protein n=1 Tax=Sorangium sp. So ce315 TaxID=3133299 RepID=UPI003F5E4474
MAALFPPWSNSVYRAALVGLVASAGGAVLGLMIYVRTPWKRYQFEPVDQPVQFDHRHHVQDDGIDCIYCHTTVTRSPTAGMPPTAKCMGCHSQIWNQSLMLEPVRRSWFSGTPIPWNRVTSVPDFVYFNHAIHVNKGVGCVSCHGRVDEMAAVYKVAPMTMGWCLQCHRLPEPHLRPLSAITDMRWDPGERRGELGAQLAKEYGVRRLTHCTACHR